MCEKNGHLVERLARVERRLARAQTLGHHSRHHLVEQVVSLRAHLLQPLRVLLELLALFLLLFVKVKALKLKSKQNERAEQRVPGRAPA